MSQVPRNRVARSISRPRLAGTLRHFGRGVETVQSGRTATVAIPSVTIAQCDATVRVVGQSPPFNWRTGVKDKLLRSRPMTWEVTHVGPASGALGIFRVSGYFWISENFGGLRIVGQESWTLTGCLKRKLIWNGCSRGLFHTIDRHAAFEGFWKFDHFAGPRQTVDLKVSGVCEGQHDVQNKRLRVNPPLKPDHPGTDSAITEVDNLKRPWIGTYFSPIFDAHVRNIAPELDTC